MFIHCPTSTLQQLIFLVIPQIQLCMRSFWQNIGFPQSLPADQYGLLCLLSRLSWTFNFLPPSWQPFIMLIAVCAAAGES